MSAAERMQLVVTTHSDDLIDEMSGNPSAITSAINTLDLRRLGVWTQTSCPRGSSDTDWANFGVPARSEGSLVSIRIYVEGGFEGSTKSNCRKAFGAFLGKVVPSGSFKIIASGSRQNAFQDFCTALRQHTEDYIVLLVDSETAIAGTAWQHLGRRDGDNSSRPTSALDDQAQLMVQVMEAWFLADQDAPSAYYGQGFLSNSLPRQQNIELIEKDECLRRLVTHLSLRKKGSATRRGTDSISWNYLTQIWLEPHPPVSKFSLTY